MADITYLWTQEGGLYLAAVLDLFLQRIVGWSLTENMREGLIKDARLMALTKRCPSLNSFVYFVLIFPP